MARRAYLAPLTALAATSAGPIRAHPQSPFIPKTRHLASYDGSYNLRFSQCIDVKLRDDDLFDDRVIDYVQNGEIVSSKSVVLFHLCQRDECFYESEDDLYMVDLRSYVKYAAQYHAGRRSDYCGACGEFEEMCNAVADDGAVVDDDAAEEEAEDEEAAAENVDAAENQEAAEQEVEEDQADANGKFLIVNVASNKFQFVQRDFELTLLALFCYRRETTNGPSRQRRHRLRSVCCSQLLQRNQ
jgi:hypothetical protein